MNIAIGADHRGYLLKDRIVSLLASWGHAVEDVGTNSAESVDYPDFAAEVSRRVASGRAERGMLICGSAVGMAITANKFNGIRAAVCADERTAEMCRRHNNANVLCLSADCLGEQDITSILQTWLATEFEGGRHERRLEKIAAIERNCGK